MMLSDELHTRPEIAQRILSRSQIQAQRGSVTPDRRSQTGLEQQNCDLLSLVNWSIGRRNGDLAVRWPLPSGL
jgi:hypothetical protein